MYEYEGHDLRNFLQTRSCQLNVVIHDIFLYRLSIHFQYRDLNLKLHYPILSPINLVYIIVDFTCNTDSVLQHFQGEFP